ncbi:ATP-binding protein [Arthrobacter sp. NPDC093125]|uniref:ATP-binding protein n=1 Tax=Arthrobacter sp. NPDC093125 TaxID=3363944 RepID=UPI00380D5893
MTGRSPDARRQGNRRPDRVLLPGHEGTRYPGSSGPRLADQARDNGWTHEEYLAAVLSREVAAREASGAEARARAAGFPARKSLEVFNFDHRSGLKGDTISHLATGAFLTKPSNIVLLWPPGTGKTHLATGLGLRVTQLGHRVLFATAIDFCHQDGRLRHSQLRNFA